MYPYYDSNQPTIVGFGSLDTNERRPFFRKFGWTQQINYFGSDASDNYNSLQLVADKRFSKGYQFRAHYTWSEARGYDSDYYAIDPKLNYGVTNTDRKHVVVLTSLVELPFGRGKTFLGGATRVSRPHRRGLVAQWNYDLGERLAFFSVVFKLWRRPRHRSLPP